MIKKIVCTLLTLAAVAACVISPYNVPNTVIAVKELSAQTEFYRTSTAAMAREKQELTRSISNFTSSRTFELQLGDIDSLLKVLSGLSGVQVQSVRSLDVNNSMSEIGEYRTGDSVGAVRVRLIVSDVPSALRSIARTQSAISSMSVESNAITMDLLLGKGV